MQRVVLMTKEGQLVRDAGIPPFNPLPDTLVWGDRIFVWSGVRPDGQARYVEAFVYTIVDYIPTEQF